MRKLEHLANAIGKTPLAEIHIRYKDEPMVIYGKVEYYNLSGSVKDRMAYGVLKDAYEKGEIQSGDTIVEATSGNTGIAFCALGAYLNHPVVIYMPDWMSEERKKLIASYGAEIRLVSAEEGGFLGSIAKAEELGAGKGYFLPKQFENPANAKGQYESFGKELIEDLKKLGKTCDGFVAGVGTGGVVMGAKMAIKEANPEAKVYPLEPEESPTLSTGNKVGKHRIAGISDEFIPDLCKLEELDEVIGVADGDSIIMAQKLAKAGLGVGISSGGNFIGAVKAQLKQGKDATIATVFSDDSKKYLSTDLMKEEPVKESYLSKDIEIEEIIIHR
ncbi:cysteine synthase family protein [Peptoniphilus sp. KCTC 25270]|uniref:PLP-dependent cysteine synthase family protein n=1 Tax=Peptoniphilus sp. KCTC 25270 TaxID=2897414 RepID=UPI001E4A00D2|nr:cysteine synthase family protein [Peptoniphilus sp. KCTC 25270]MCD1147661.1 cysteine synthase family protein [Peptoniphilus sp. KCTC 25270]